MPFADNDGIRIHYQIEGSGPPLVLHTGFGGRLEAYYRNGFVDALKGNYQLILLDPRGQGRSDKPHDPTAYTLRKRVADVLAVLDDVGVPRSHFYGYSMGARIGFGLGLYAQDRFASLILGGMNAYPPEPHPEEDL
ncbi:MAG TPA: alpha/beta hydrolase, partial [Thermomicrobiaceae bacterium]|nr:alpha/beta hydrolase [Thermomicrobiaceae bacterium]